MTGGARLLRVPRPGGLAPVPYAYGAVVPAGARLVVLAGACPLDEAGSTVAPGDVRAQARRCVANARLALEAADAALSDVVLVRVQVASADRADLAAAWVEVRRLLGDVPGTLSGTTVLGWPDQLVEVEVVAAVTDPPYAAS